jgi:tetratricopeptide (TPR) repeat protein
MSLLLDALKKAEKAKDDAKRREQVTGVSLSDDRAGQVRTRNELPDISTTLEIRSQDVSSESHSTSAPSIAESPVPDAFSTQSTAARSQVPKRESAFSDATGAPSAKESSNQDDAAQNSQSAQRAAARHVFEAKFREPNPRLPFYITMALLGMFAVGTVVYFWYQLRPPAPLVNTNAKAPSDEKKMEAQTDRTISAQAPPQQGGPLQPSEQAIPGLPSQSSSKPAEAAAAAKTSLPSDGASVPAQKPSAAAIARAPDREPMPAPRQRAPTPAPRVSADPSQVSINRPSAAVHPKIEVGWAAYNRGDLNASRSSYQDMLKEEPTNRDALLGMAAVEVRSNRLEEAEGYYRTLLQLNPRDPYAQAGLLSIRGQMGDQSQSESRLKSLIVNDPESQVLHFTLGNQYAQQGRWPEAQQAYFKAYSGDPENPDFAYNLAVSLDRVRQPRLALEYYRRAVSLSQLRSSNFDQALARNRVQELAR